MHITSLFLKSLSYLGNRRIRLVVIMVIVAAAAALLAAGPVSAQSSTPSGPPAGSQNCRTYHVVLPGETLHQIAQRYGTTWQAIAAANNLANPDQIYPGQRLCIPGDTSQTGRATVVNCYYLNVRSGPGVSFSVVEVLNRGAQVQLLGRNSASTWVLIRTDRNTEGWVNASYLSSNIPIGTLPVVGAPAQATGTVTSSFLNARSGPSVSFPVVAVLSHGQTVPVTHRAGGGSTWVRIILPNGNPAWVNSSYLNLSVPLNSLPVA